MKVAIITLPLGDNYGGIMQAFALQYLLKEQGHDVYTIEFEFDRPLFYEIIYVLRSIKYLITGEKRKKRSFFPNSRKDQEEKRKQKINLTVNTRKFININIQTLTINVQNINKLNDLGFDCFIVGSDQVWRKDYNPDMTRSYLGFLIDNNVKKIAYAASFGIDYWDYSEKLTKKCSKLLNKFDHVSVREKSGVSLCKEYLVREDVQHVLDPTFLIKREIYEALTKEYLSYKKHGLYSYILDNNHEKEAIVLAIKKHLGTELTSVMPVPGEEILEQEYTMAPVEEWLQGFINAKYVVTDSFHGVIFSIIFRKQFFVIVNEDRGASRFISLLRMLGLKDRIINTSLFDKNLLHPKINYKEVEQILNKNIAKSTDFIFRCFE